MLNKLRPFYRVVAVFAVSAVVGCGGGGGSATVINNQSPNPLPTMASCNAKNQILVNGDCQPCRQDQIFADGNCQFCRRGETRIGNVCMGTMIDCHSADQMYVSGRCQSCGNGMRLGENNTCMPVSEISISGCNSADQIFKDNRCQSCPPNQIREGNLCVPTFDASAREFEMSRLPDLGEIVGSQGYRGYYGQGVTVGVVDTAVLTSHPDLNDNIVPGYNVIDGSNNIGDDITGHGTRVAGVIAAERNGEGMHGVAPQAKLMPVQIGENGMNARLSGAANVHVSYRIALD